MPSPLVLINSTAQLNGVNVSASSTVTIALVSTVGVSNWNVTCFGTDELTTPAAINGTLVINHATNVATFTAPASGSNGAAMVFQSTINNGVDVNGVLQPSYFSTFGVYILTGISTRVGAAGETTEGDSIYGWVSKLNIALR